MRKKYITNILLWAPLLIIITMSIFLMLQAQTISSLYKNHAFKQTIFFIIGITLLLFRKKLKIKWLFDYSSIIYIINILLLILVLFLGETTNGAKAWFKIGYFSFQPSELMKLSLCLYLSQITEKKTFTKKSDELKYLLQVTILTILPSILVFLEPDTGAIIFYFLICFSIIITSNISKKWLILLISLITIFIITFFYAFYFEQEILIKLIGTSFFYRVERLLEFQKGMQIENALIAIGSSPLIKFNITENLIYIPEAPTDFALAQASTIFGIVGLFIILIAYFLLDLNLLNILHFNKKKKKNFQISFLTIFIFNQFYNIFMNIGLLPIMGIPLPFFSYGGSTIIVYFLFLFIFLKISDSSKLNNR